MTILMQNFLISYNFIDFHYFYDISYQKENMLFSIFNNLQIQQFQQVTNMKINKSLVNLE